MISGATLVEQAAIATERAKEYVAGATNAIANARTLVSGDAQLFSVVPHVEDLRRGLDAEPTYEKLDAMKRIVAQMCKGADMSHLFPDVVKNIHVPSIELRKLIYLYVSHYADVCPDAALLSISAFQKDLVDPSVHVRSLALRMLSFIRIPSIHPVVMIAVRRCVTDPASLVRRTAAIALYQMYTVSGAEADVGAIQDLLRELLADANADVVGAAAMSFSIICPDAVELLHPVYRHLCASLVICEEWGQVFILRVLLRYARTQFVDLTLPPSEQRRRRHGYKGGASSRSGSSASSSSSWSDSDDETGQLFQREGRCTTSDAAALDADHQLLLTTAHRLLRCINSAVTVGACAVLLHCGPLSYLKDCVKPLMRLLSCVKDAQGIVLNVVYTLAMRGPAPLAPYLKLFFLCPGDPADVRELKLRILSYLATSDNMVEILREFRVYTRSFSAATVVEATKALGLIAARHPQLSGQTMRLLTPLLSHKDANVVLEAVTVLRLMVVQGKGSTHTSKLVLQLMQDAISDKVQSRTALATILWLVGECITVHEAIATAAPDCFRVMLGQFTKLDAVVKPEVLTLGCKVWLHLGGSGELAERFRQLYLYAIELARYDAHYSIRDVGRMLECTLDRQSEHFVAFKTALLGKKPQQQLNDPFRDRSRYELGTFTHLLGKPVLGYCDLPEWPLVAPDPTVRDPPKSMAAQYNTTTTSASSSSVYSSSSGGSDQYYDDDTGKDDESSSEDDDDESSEGTEGSAADDNASQEDSRSSTTAVSDALPPSAATRAPESAAVSTALQSEEVVTEEVESALPTVAPQTEPLNTELEVLDEHAIGGLEEIGAENKVE